MDGNTSSTRAKPARFKVQPFETSFRSSNKDAADVAEASKIASEAVKRPEGKTPETKSETKPAKGKKKFVPEPIETIRRSHKAGDETPALAHNEKRADCLITEKPKFSKPQLIETSKWSHRRGTDSTEQLLQNPSEYRGFRAPRRQSSTYPHFNTRQHSYALPELEPIISQTSSEKSGSEVPSLSTSPSMTSRDPSFLDLQVVGRRRESCDDRFSGYLLALAARAAERQLKEQALAVFPNANISERAEHFAIGHDIDSRPGTAGSVPFMQDADIDMLREDSLEKLERERTMQSSEYEDLPSFLPHEILSHFDKTPSGPVISATTKQPIIVEEPDPLLEIMRRAARAPWLGEGIEFSLCQSPKRLSIDVNRFDAETYHPGDEPDAEKQSPPCGGLWMGLCKASPKQTGLHSLHASPAKCMENKVTVTEADLDTEFTDDFVTEVYNYLALGYPSLALPFDEELSRETGTPVAELQSCDHQVDVHGYIGYSESVLDKETVVGKAPRWLALRMYIRAWGRRNKDTTPKTSMLGTGGAVLHRRGSWRN